MHSLLLYILESGICLTVFFLLYQVFLKKETYYRLNRAYLLFALFFSLLAPVLGVHHPGLLDGRSYSICQAPF